MVDTFSDRKGDTNPSWFDLSPLAETEGKIPKAIRFASPIRPDGWFHGEYAAAAGEFDFSGKGSLGTGTVGKPDTEALAQLSKTGQESETPFIQSIGKLAQAAKECRERPTVMTLLLDEMALRFSDAPSALHDPIHRPLFERGLADFKARATSGELAAILDSMTWDRFQHSDGLVESQVALNTCRQIHGGTPQEKQRCRVFSDRGGETSINHFSMAGHADEVVSHLIFELTH